MDGSDGEPPLAPLGRLRQWLTWRRDRKQGNARAKRKPVHETMAGHVVSASTTRPRTWRWPDEAEALAARLRTEGSESGIGFVAGALGPDGDYVGLLDLDACVVAALPVAWAQEVVARFDTYTELSPSSTGLRLVFVVAAADVPAVEALIGKTREGNIRAGRKWFRPSTTGTKAEAIEFIWRGYGTITWNRLHGSPLQMRRATLADIQWLFQAGEALQGGSAEARGERERAVDADPASIDTPRRRRFAADKTTTAPAPATQDRRGGTLPASDARPARFIASATRMLRWARQCDDAEFQLLAALASAAAKPRGGLCEAWLPRDRLLALPGAEAGSKRGTATISRTLARLQKSGRCGSRPTLKKIAEATRPDTDKPARATLYAMPAWWVQPARKEDQPPRARMALATWKKAVWSLPPFALRVWSWLLAVDAIKGRDPAAPFTPRTTELAKAFGTKDQRINAALDAIRNAGLFDEVQARCGTRRTPATYLLAAERDERRNEHHTTTPPPLG